MLPFTIHQRTTHIKPVSDRFFYNILESSPTPLSHNSPIFPLSTPLLAHNKLQGGSTNIKAWPLYTAYLLGPCLHVGISCATSSWYTVGTRKQFSFSPFPAAPRMWGHVWHSVWQVRTSMMSFVWCGVRARRASSAVHGADRMVVAILDIVTGNADAFSSVPECMTIEILKKSFFFYTVSKL